MNRDELRAYQIEIDSLDLRLNYLNREIREVEARRQAIEDAIANAEQKEGKE